MTRLAAEVADGLVVHPFHSDAWLRGHLLPAVEAGLARGGRAQAELQLHFQVLVVTGRDEREIAGVREATRAQIAFYGSTPGYRAVLEAEGRPDLQEALRAMTRAGDWASMAARIDDDLLGRIAIVGAPDVAAAAIRARYGALAERVAVATPFPISDEALGALVAALRS